MSDISNMSIDQVALVCAAFERHARMYWERSRVENEPVWVLLYCQRMSAKFYGEARKFRAEAINRTGR